jgi:hypothetical protein
MPRVSWSDLHRITERGQRLPRADAELQIAQELSHLIAAKRPAAGSLDEEFTRDWLNALNPIARGLVDQAGLSVCVGMAWGFTHATFNSTGSGPTIYTPAPSGGDATLSVPCFDGDEIFDCAGMSLETGMIGTRLGVAGALGADQIERARRDGYPLIVAHSLAGWLRLGGAAALVLDWECAGRAFDRISVLLCSKAIEKKLRDAVRCCDAPSFVCVPKARFDA